MKIKQHELLESVWLSLLSVLAFMRSLVLIEVSEVLTLDTKQQEAINFLKFESTMMNSMPFYFKNNPCFASKRRILLSSTSTRCKIFH
jgi:hypothetical protein